MRRMYMNTGKEITGSLPAANCRDTEIAETPRVVNCRNAKISETLVTANCQDVEIAETLLAAGCGDAEIEMIVSCIRKGDRKNTEKLIEKCRRKQLERLHDSQACIDRLDYLSYQLRKL